MGAIDKGMTASVADSPRDALPCGGLDGAMMEVDYGANGVAEIAQEVPAIGHLDGIRRTLTDTVLIPACTVTGDDLDPRVLTQPRSEGLGLAVWQELHDHVAFEIDKDGAVATASPPPLCWFSNGYAAGTFANYAQSSTPSTLGAD